MFGINFSKFRNEKSEKPLGVTNIVAGLGNPGAKYVNTRHNAGFIVVDYIARSNEVELKAGKFNAESGILNLENRKVLLLKPQTYMNLSGESLVAAMNFYKIPSEKVVVILDDVNFAVGRMRVRENGSHGGHNGMKNILQMCGSSGFPRIKVGVGGKPENFPLDKWVISNFSSQEKDVITKICPYVKTACEMVLRGDFAQAMSDFNGLNLAV